MINDKECLQVQTDSQWPFWQSSCLSFVRQNTAYFWKEFDKSNPHMKFGRNWVINFQVIVFTSANGQAVGIFATILVTVHQTKPKV